MFITDIFGDKKNLMRNLPLYGINYTYILGSILEVVNILHFQVKLDGNYFYSIPHRRHKLHLLPHWCHLPHLLLLREYMNHPKWFSLFISYKSYAINLFSSSEIANHNSFCSLTPLPCRLHPFAEWRIIFARSLPQ